MKLALIGKSERRSGVEGGKRRLTDQFDVPKACAMGRFQFVFQKVPVIPRRAKKVAIYAFKFTADSFRFDNPVNLIDGSSVALSSEAGSSLSM